MGRQQSASIATPELMVDLVRHLPEQDKPLCSELNDELSMPDTVALLDQVSDGDLLEVLRLTRHRSAAVSTLNKLGVTCPSGRLPKTARMLRVRLRAALNAGRSDGQLLLLQATDPVMKLLVARAADLEVDLHPDQEARLGNLTLQRLTIAAARRRDPSLPLTLIGLHRHQPELLAALVEDQASRFAAASEKITDEGFAEYVTWAHARVGIGHYGESGSSDASDDNDAKTPRPASAGEQAAALQTTGAPTVPAQPGRHERVTAPAAPSDAADPATVPVDLDGALSQVGACEEQTALGVTAAERTAAALTAGARPEPADIKLLHEITTALGALFSQVPEAPATLPALRAHLEQARAAADAGRSELLELLRASHTGSGLDEALVALTQTVTRLLDNWPPVEQDDQALVEHLQQLHALIVDASAPDADDAQLFDRSEALLDALPAQLRKVILAANRGRIQLTTDVAPSGTPALAQEAGAEATDTSGNGDGKGSSPAPAPPAPSANDTSAAPAQPAAASATPTQSAPPKSAPAPVQTSDPAPVLTSQPRGEAAPSAPDAASTTDPDPAPRRAPAGEPAAASPSSTPDEAEAEPGTGTSRLPEPAPIAQIVADTAGRLLNDGRTGLAHHLLAAAGHSSAADVTLLTALAEPARTRTSPTALELTDLCEAVEIDDLTAAGNGMLAAAALVKTALITGDTHIGQLLHDLSAHLPATWSRLCRLTSDAVSSGALETTTVAETADQAALDHAVTDASAAAARRAEHAPKLREHRAQILLKTLRSADSDLGAALHAAASNSTEQLNDARQLTTTLVRGEVRRLVLEADRELRQTGKALPADRIGEIVDILIADRDAIGRWVSAASRANARIAPDANDWGHDRLVELHELVTEQHTALADELQAHTPTGLIGTGQVTAAARLLSDITDVASGRPAPAGAEPSVQRITTTELLKVPGSELDSDHATVRLPDLNDRDKLDALLAAAEETSWEPAMRRHLNSDNFDAALRCAEQLDLQTGQAGHYTGQVHAARPIRLEQLKEQVGKLRLLLVQARRADDESLQDTVDSSLAELELLLQTSGADLRRVSAELTRLQQQAQQLHDQTISSLRARLAELDLPDSDRVRLDDQISQGQFDEVDDEINNRKLNKRLPVYGKPADLMRFFPHVPDAMPRGITDDVLTTIRDGGTIGPLNFADIGRTEQIIDLLSKWRDQGQALRPGGSGWVRDTARDLLIPALVGVGINAPSTSLITLDAPGTAGKGWRFVELRDVTRIGKAMVPAFGSQAQRRYRLLLAYDIPNVQTLDSLRQSDGSNVPLIVCYFGTLSSADRLELARTWSDPTVRPTIVLDDAALTYVLAAQGELSGSLFATLMNVTLPFTTTAPFDEMKRRDVPVEMFYGRDREQRKIEALAGETIIYGGRNMGKSALLNTIKEQAEDSRSNRKAILLELPRDEAFGAADTIWAELADALEREGLTPARRAGKKQTQVERAVDSWLEDNPDGELLIMIDEVDGFFNADAPGGFAETNRLFNLKDRHPRCKVVFAGLHSVNHFHGTGNVPFSPAGALPIGPLDPADAYRLLTGPLHAMGYFLEPQEARRILMYCNYQPYLIQMFGQQLLASLHARRPETATPPPWDITTSQVDRVMHDPAMRDKIFRAFRMTLELDKRFLVIVNLLALHAYDGKITPLSDRELFEDCKQAWPAGFADTPMASFRELLHELAGLGILGPAGERGGRGLRTSALLPNLGSRADIEHALAEIAEHALTEKEARGLIRPALDDKGRPGPLTTDQIATLAGRKGNRTHVLIGSVALGLDHVAEALTGRQPILRKVEFASDGGSFRRLLKTGEAGETRMTVVSELWRKAPRLDACIESLDNARSEEFWPADRSASRAAVLVAGPQNSEWLTHALYNDPGQDELIVTLDRFNARTLPLQWRDQGRLEELGSPEHAPKLLALTGGWPALVDQVATRTLKVGAARALNEFAEQRQDPTWAKQLLVETGATVVDSDLTLLVRALAEYNDNCGTEELQLLQLEHGIIDLDKAVTLADWFSLVDRDSDGKIRLAPLLSEAWQQELTSA